MPPRKSKANIQSGAAEKNIMDFMERRMREVGNTIQGTAVRKLNRGQPVRRSKSGRLIGLAPSKPGEPPKTLSGRLKQSVAFSIIRKQTEIIVRIGTNVVYGRRLELGFHGRDKAGRNINQQARPWLRPSVTENLGRIKDILTR